jgi:hypothetical protein
VLCLPHHRHCPQFHKLYKSSQMQRCCNSIDNALSLAPPEQESRFGHPHPRQHPGNTIRDTHSGGTSSGPRPLCMLKLSLELSSKLIQQLQIPQVCYHTDSQLLASQDPILQAPDWRIRPSIAQFIQNSSDNTYICKKIPRQINKTAHTLVKFACKANDSSCNFTCINPHHYDFCPARLVLANAQWDVFTPILVNCL